MNPPDDWQLVDEYASSGSHAVFEALVKRHAGWVYAAARRRVGSADLADDVTQATFIVLARKARSISRRRSLAAWLYRVVNYAAIDALRRQGTRRRHERLAAKPEVAMASDDQQEAIARYLDAALDSLSGPDREVVILRYFNEQTFEQIGRTQRVAASTVQRRLERSLARIRYQFRQNGVVTAPAALGAALAAIGTCTAPPSATAGLTALASAAGALPPNTAGPIGLAKGILHTMKLIKLKFAAAALIAFTVLGAGGVVITRAVAQLVSTQPPGNAAPPTPPVATVSSPAIPASGDADFAKQFRADWLAIDLNVTHFNAANSANKDRDDSQTLSIQCAMTVLDASHVLGFDRLSSLDITRIVDDAGHDLTPLATQSAPNNHWYGPLAYIRQFDNGTKQLAEVLMPQQFTVAMKADSKLPNRLALVEGYLKVLTFDRQEHVDLPYAPNGAPVSLLPGRSLHFAAATHDANSYAYQLVDDGPADEKIFNGQFEEGQPLPERMLIVKYLIDSNGNAIGGETHAYGNFGGNGADNGVGGTTGSNKIAAMRFEIAIGLHEMKVPVSLKNIDVPHLTAVAP